LLKSIATNPSKFFSPIRDLRVVLLGFSCLLASVSFSQEQESDSSNTVTEGFSEQFLKQAEGIQYDSIYVAEKLKPRPQKITAFGYYRLFLYGRNIVEPYPGLAPFEKAFGVGDGYREPMLSLTVVGRPNGKTSFGSELFMFTPYDGSIDGNVFSTNLGINFYGNFRTDHGNFGVRAGGIHWYNLSPFTIGVFQILDRFSIFDRTPWEGVTNTGKYEAYYESGVTSPGDLRWNNQAFQGLIINGGKLPGDFGFDLFWGKTQPNGGLAGGILEPSESIPTTIDAGNVPTYAGFAGTDRTLPSYITGGKLAKSFGEKRQTLTYNTIWSRTSVDSLSTDVFRAYEVHTLGLDLKIGQIGITGELGAGSYKSPTYDKKWGEALMLRFRIPKLYTYIPLDVQVYRISKNYFNQNGEIATNSNQEILEDNGLTINAFGVGGQLAVVNQLVHNRQGININTEVEFNNFKLAAGWGWSTEIDAESEFLSFVHRVNGLAMSRVYNPFPAGATGPTVFGPYERKFSFFRGVSEVVPTTDVDPATATAINKKQFNAIDLQGKYTTNLFDRDLFFFYIGSFGGVTNQFEIAPVFNEDSYLFVQYHEFDVYYEIFKGFLITGYYGIETAKGGEFTLWNEDTQLPLDQLNTGIGVGFDWQLAENSGLYVRYRWMNFEDRSFPLDVMRGRELTIELKTFF